MRSPRRCRGYKLVEYMISLFIYSTCLLFVYGMFPASMQALNQSRYVFLANQVARQEMEYLKNMNWNTLADFQNIIKTNPDKFYRKTTMVCHTEGTKTDLCFESNPMITVFSKDKNGQPEILNVRVMVKYRYGSLMKGHSGYRMIDYETLLERPR